MLILDWEKLGLKCGIEIHQRLDTEQKLFCHCRSSLSEKGPTDSIKRKMHAVIGEMGVADKAVLHEARKGRVFHYNIYNDENCLVETDSEPPHNLNREALKIALTIARMFKADIPDELHIMRKAVIDGSNTSGFQRTLILGLDGEIETSNGIVGITNISLEEESSQIHERSGDSVTYGLDRLGIPLVEIGTAADIKTPEQAKEVSKKIGMVMRSTGKVKRGIGTIRQDINVSIAGGARVEMKGSQDLKLIPKLIETEVLRQSSLIKIKNELVQKGFKKIPVKVKNVSNVFSKTENKIMQKNTVFAIVIPRFAGFLKKKITNTRTLGNEIANYVKVRAGIPGIIHSDEDLDKYRLSKEFNKLKELFSAKEGDTVIIMAADEKLADLTAVAISERINQLLLGVPKEVRKTLLNTDTEYLRPLAGSARMYPETDVPPIMIDDKLLKSVENSIPETWDEKTNKLVKRFSVSRDVAKEIVHSGRDDVFIALSKKYDPKLVSSTMVVTFNEISREGFPTDGITQNHMDELFSLVKSKKLAKEAIGEILKVLSKNPGKKIADVVKKSGISGIESTDLQKIVERVLSEKKELLTHPRREKILMGLVMKEARGKIDGKLVMQTLIKALKKKRK